MKKKDEITEKIDQLEKTERADEKKNRVKYGPGRRSVTVGVTLGLCCALIVGGYFLVKSLIDTSAADQTSNALAQSFDSGSFTAGSAAADTGISYPAGSSAPGENGNAQQPGSDSSSAPSQTTTTRDSGAITDSGAGADPVEADPGAYPGTTPGGYPATYPGNGSIYVPGGSDDIVIGGNTGDKPDITLPTGSGYEVTLPSGTSTSAGSYVPGSPDRPDAPDYPSTTAAARTTTTAFNTTSASGQTTTQATVPTLSDAENTHVSNASRLEIPDDDPSDTPGSIYDYFD